MKDKPKNSMDDADKKELCNFIKEQDEDMTEEERELSEHIQRMFGPLPDDPGTEGSC